MFLFLAGALFPFVMIATVELLPRSISEFVLWTVVILWSGALMWTLFRLLYWPCPRCNTAWWGQQGWRASVARKCVKCGLGIYEEP